MATPLTDRDKRSRERAYNKYIEELGQKYLSVTTLTGDGLGMFGDIAFALSKEDLQSPHFNPSTDVPKVYVVKAINKWRYTDYHAERDRTLIEEIQNLSLVRTYQNRATNGHSPADQIAQLLKNDTDNIWFSMETINGPQLETLLNHMKGKYEDSDPARRAFAVSVMQQMLEIFHWLHLPTYSKPWMLVHGDLHLGNVMIDLSNNIPSTSKAAIPNQPMPSVRVIDLGCAVIKRFDPAHIPTSASDVEAKMTDDDRTTIHEYRETWNMDYDNLDELARKLFPKPEFEPLPETMEAAEDWYRKELLFHLQNSDEHRIDLALDVMGRFTAFRKALGPQNEEGMASLVGQIREITIQSYSAPIELKDVTMALEKYFEK